MKTKTNIKHIKIVRNYPTKRKIELSGKSYADYLQIEVENGRMDDSEKDFWLKADDEFGVLSIRPFRTFTKQIPYNS